MSAQSQALPVPPESVLLTVPQTAQRLGVTSRCLRKWREQWPEKRKGPRFIRVSSNAVRYRLSDVIEWIDREVIE